MDRRVSPPKRATSPIWGTPPLCKQALRMIFFLDLCTLIIATFLYVLIQWNHPFGGHLHSGDTKFDARKMFAYNLCIC